MTKKIALHGAYFPNNYGDVLILAIQTKWIKDLTNSEVVLPFATEPYRKNIEVSSEYGVKSLESSEKLVYGAGGYFGEPDSNTFRWGLNFIKNHVKPFRIAKRKKIHYAIIGTGAGKISNPLARIGMRQIIKKADVIAVRDIESKKAIQELGGNDKDIHVTADVALSLTKKDIPIENMERMYEFLKETNTLKYGIHMGVDRLSVEFGENINILLDEIINFLNDNKSISPVIIIDNDNKAQNNNARYLLENLTGKTLVYKHDNIWDTTALLSKLDYVITNKLHIGIVSYALGNIPISFPYHPKTQRFYKQIRLEELCTPLKDIERKKVNKLLRDTIDEEWFADKKAIQNEMAPIMREKAFQNKSILEEFLNKKLI